MISESRTDIVPNRLVAYLLALLCCHKHVFHRIRELHYRPILISYDVPVSVHGTADCNSQVKPGKRGSEARRVPPILDRLNLSAELWLQTVAGFAKRRSANSVTPASRFNAAANTTLKPMASNR